MRITATVMAVLLALPGAALAGRQDAEIALTEARASVGAAQRAGAVELAGIELKTARDMLARAEASMERRRWDDVEREASMARADGRLAEARTRQYRAERSAAELEAAVETLRRELQRQGGGS
ncbi:MAG TPA: DUF4398 domain-containing protein [Xanthomonadaceae bacterium]|nr:DUF4398 domain-containing protein [Xanthomonadaceae bacterium]